MYQRVHSFIHDSSSLVEDKKSSRVNTLYKKRAVFLFGDFLSLGRRGDEQPAKLSVPSALAPRLATLATTVGFWVGGQRVSCPFGKKERLNLPL